MTGTEIYKRTAAYERQAREIRLHAPHWKLLLAYDGQRSLSEVALSAEIAFAEALPLTQKFLDQEWIEEMPITLEQYMKRIGTRDVSGTGAVVAPPTVLHEPGKESAQPSSSPATGAAPVEHVPPPLPVTPAASPVAAAKPAEFTLGPSKVPPMKTPARAMRLGAVVDFITSLVGNISVGQLLVYRVFLRVPPELLLEEDIASVYLVNDTSVVLGEKLQKAIADAVSAVAKKALPDSVFAAV
jgi:hypothetical protein